MNEMSQGPRDLDGVPRRIDASFREKESEVVATGTWLYDGIVAKRICIRSKPARLSSSRYDGDDQLDDSRPIPVTENGLVYRCDPGGGEALTLEKAKAWAEAQPWGPVSWD